MKRTALKRGAPLRQKTELRRGKPLIASGFIKRKKHKPKPKAARPKYKRDWNEMNTDSWRNAKGLCDRCGIPLHFGTPAAHLIPRDIKKPELDCAWNLANLSYVECHCHTYFDNHRGEIAYKALVLKDPGEAWLVCRIEADDSGRLRRYFARRAVIWEGRLEMEKAREGAA